MIEFEVNGVPAPQGSKNPWGGEANKRTRPWRGQVSQVAAATMQGRDVLLGPVRVNVIFAFPRPKSHFRTGKNAHLLRDNAPYWHTSVPDADKLERAIGDALQGVVVRDDKQICAWVVEKIYDNRAYARLKIEELT